MRVLVFFALTSVLVSVAIGAEVSWSEFKRKFGKSYSSRAEELLRHDHFLRKQKEVEEWNADKSNGYKKGINHMSDWTDKEIDRLLNLKFENINIHSMHNNSADDNAFLKKILDSDVEIPDTVDWRLDPNRVSKVKNQGHCGSCWAFAAIGVLEGQTIVREFKGQTYKSLVPLSEQDLVDCDTEDEGCGGGLTVVALDEINRKGGINSEKDYPYEGVDRTCRSDQHEAAFTTLGSSVLPPHDEEALKKVVAVYGPVAASILALSSFMEYKSGVLKDEDCIPEFHNHAVLIVGYGTTKDTKEDYWLVKNSWSEEWGEEGYIRMARNMGDLCNVAGGASIAKF